MDGSPHTGIDGHICDPDMIDQGDNTADKSKVVNCPSESDVQLVFKRLLSIYTNNTCFDCNSNNATWASITYGVFICIDCSAVHRSLGVHVTFVRSTQLDKNWTWLQLRKMQLGGNSNALTFFQRHNCITGDSRQKYTSHTAELYREKLHKMAIQAMWLHELSVADPAMSLMRGQRNVEAALSSQPDVAQQELHKPTICNRNPQAKHLRLGAKKGLGAQKVKVNFAEIEYEAMMADKLKVKAAEEQQIMVERTAEEEGKQIASMRLAYQDLSLQRKKEQEKLKQVDPMKAQQIERLGMGFSSRTDVSHSALSDVRTVEQQSASKAISTRHNTYVSHKGCDSFKPQSRQQPSSGNYACDNRPVPRRDPPSVPLASVSNEAQRRFGNAKGISSEKFFDGSTDDSCKQKADLSRFEGLSGFSSADYFGTGSSGGGNHLNSAGLECVIESVIQDMAIVGDKLSSIAKGVMSSIRNWNRY
jgi:ADP-ribosylation factor GTPase-activating protein 2/3